MSLVESVAVIQGVFFVLTGIWPILSIKTFETVTGPKTDDWLVKTVGAMITVVGLVILLAGLRHAITLEIMLLAVGSSAALTAVDLVYVPKKVIGKIYLLDAAAEFGLIVAWIITWAMSRV